ncbi:MAG: hypothetical protein GY810_25860 [Aureispira sp.]|nr:hypothetical protein [Aureispira sp.]
MDWRESIRKRPGMFIGSINDKGFIELLKTILSDLLYNTSTDFVQLQLLDSNTAKLHLQNIKKVFPKIWNLAQIAHDGKYNIGLQTLNALSQKFTIQLHSSTNDISYQQNFIKGTLTEDNLPQDHNFIDSLTINFQLDQDIWGNDFAWNQDFITHQLREFAYLHKRVQFEMLHTINNRECRLIHHFKNGLKDKIDMKLLNGLGGSFFNTTIDTTIADFHIEVAFAFREYTVDEPFLKSYVNDYYTHENGSHIDGLLKGLTYGVMKYFQKHNLTQQYKISEKGIKQNLVAALNIRLSQPVFSGCVRNKLANSEIIEPIANYVSEILFSKIEQAPDATKKLINKFQI